MSGLSQRSRFVFRYGLLLYGGGLFVIFNVINFLRLKAQEVSLLGLAVWLVMTAMLSLLLGFGFGMLAWERMKRRRR